MMATAIHAHEQTTAANCWSHERAIGIARRPRPPLFPQSVRRKHHDPRTDRRALVKVDHILVDHADATGGNARTDGPRFDGAVDAIERVLIALPEVHGAGTERVARASMHAEATLQFAHLSPQFGLALNHLFGRIPVRPLLLVVNCRRARPSEALASHAYTIAERPPAFLDKIKEVILRIDNDRTGLLPRGVKDRLAQIFRIDIGQFHRGDGKALAVYRT